MRITIGRFGKVRHVKFQGHNMGPSETPETVLFVENNTDCYSLMSREYKHKKIAVVHQKDWMQEEDLPCFKLIIAGSRGITDLEVVEQAVRESGFKPTVIISGGALGVDTLAVEYAQKYNIPYEVYLPDWRPNGIYDITAGHKRNAIMGDKGDALVAIWNGKSTGTRGMISIMTRLKKPNHVKIITPYTETENATTPKVYNKYKDKLPPGTVYIGRPSKWGNPFTIGKDGDRASVVEKYRAWIADQPELIQAAEKELAGKSLVCYCAPCACHGDVLLEIANPKQIKLEVETETLNSPGLLDYAQELLDVLKGRIYSWRRRGGYEVSTKGDKRFSALNAIMPDGRSLEEHYQCDIKGYDVGGTNWKIGKGRPPMDKSKDLLPLYIDLWRTWAKNNPQLIEELSVLATKKDFTLSDCFAATEVNQAHALAVILNERTLAWAGKVIPT